MKQLPKHPSIIPQSKSTLLLILLLSLTLISLTLLELTKPQQPSKKAAITPETTLSTATLIQEGLIESPTNQIQINLTLDPTTNQFTLQNAYKLTTQANQPPTETSPYTAELFHQTSNTHLSTPLIIHSPHYESIDQLLDSNPDSTQITSVPELPIHLTLRTSWSHDSAQLTIKHQNQTVFTAHIRRFETPVLTSTTSNSFLSQDALQADITPQDYFHLVIISDQYNSSEITQFHQDVERFLNSGLLQIDPFPQFAHRLQFHIIDNPNNDLGCGFHSSNISRLLTCNPHQVRTIVNLAQVPWDKIAVIVNEDKFGGSANGIGGDIAISSRHANLPQLLTHELGHSLGLHDEYYTGRYLLPHRNCAPHSSPYPAWYNLINQHDYQQICSTKEAFRSTAFSLMNRLGTPFNPVSQEVIKRVLNHQSPNLPNPDINQDQQVTQKDYTTLIKNFNSSNPTYFLGDATHDGTIDISDFNLIAKFLNQ